MTTPRPELEAEATAAAEEIVSRLRGLPLWTQWPDAQQWLRDAITAAWATAHARGRAEGLEAAAQVAERDYRIFQAIRALGGPRGERG